MAHQVGFFLFGITSFVISLIMLLVLVLFFVRMRKMQKSLHTFLRGKNGKDLEQTLLTQADEIKALDHDVQELFDISNRIHTLAFKSTHKVAMIRFNPFKDLGGNQSFCIAFLDGKDNGVVVSSLHTREGTRIYAKEITQGAPLNGELTTEEQTVIDNARANQ